MTSSLGDGGDASGMPQITVLLADDSLTTRGAIRRALALTPDIQVVAEASNGQAAIDLAGETLPSVIVLDIEMPILSGLEALPRILMASPNSRIVVASALTHRNAAISLQALHLGASDYIGKPSLESGQTFESFSTELATKIRALARARSAPAIKRAAPLASAPPAGSTLAPRSAAMAAKAPGAHDNTPVKLRGMSGRKPDIIVVGSSTGGPQALMRLLPKIVERASQPILIVQHMPPTFTKILSEHVASYTGRPCREAEDGEIMKAGHIYVAPGNYHMRVSGRRLSPVLRLDQGAQENFCRPAVDPLLRSVAEVFGANAIACILTGMGQDGLAGAREFVAAGGTLFAQDEESSVVWGMPGAVAMAGLCTAVLQPEALGERIGRIAASGTSASGSGA